MHNKIEPSPLTLKVIIENSVRSFQSLPAVSFVNGKPVNYRELGEKISQLSSYLFSLGLNKGDKVALLSHNMPNWVIAYFAVTSNGMIIVPILPDFTHEEVENVLSHSESKVLIVSERLFPKVDNLVLPFLEVTILLDNFTQIDNADSANLIVNNRIVEVYEEDTAAIIYTSGTTGRSKGVMLSHRNLAFIAMQSYHFQSIDSSDVFLSFLPLSHTYENTIGMIFPILYGASIYYLEKPPTAAALLPAMAQIKPTLMLSVPLIMEKLYKTQIQSKFTHDKFRRMIYKTPIFRILIHHFAGKKLKQSFGGRLKFFGIGGAKLDSRVERFLKEARFPYAIGYGLTETSPLLAGASPKQTKLQSTGYAVIGVQLKINEPDKKGIGEVLVKGPNVMQGYYKNQEATNEVFTTDGWFKTGDSGRFDSHNRLYIKGRIKNTIIGASGENIYPEDIESIINNQKYVIESLVIEEDGFLVAKVLLDIDNLEKNIDHLKTVIGDKREKHHIWLRHFTKELNSKLNRVSQIKRVDVIDEPFEKTSSHKIKRFKYVHNDKSKGKKS